MADLDFLPSPQATVVQEGRRDVALVFLGGTLVTGYGDPKGQGWVTRVVGRTQHPDLDLTAYNLGVRGATSTIKILGARDAVDIGAEVQISTTR